MVAQGRTAGVCAPALVSLSWHRKVESVLLELKATLVAAVPQMAGGALVICTKAPHLSHFVGEKTLHALLPSVVARVVVLCRSGANGEMRREPCWQTCMAGAEVSTVKLETAVGGAASALAPAVRAVKV